MCTDLEIVLARIEMAPAPTQPAGHHVRTIHQTMTIDFDTGTGKRARMDSVLPAGPSGSPLVGWGAAADLRAPELLASVCLGPDLADHALPIAPHAASDGCKD